MEEIGIELDCITIRVLTKDMNDKENLFAVRKPSSGTRTPPRVRRCANSNTLFVNGVDAQSNSKSSMRNGEDYSFHKLRGALQKFEKTQKDHTKKNHILVKHPPVAAAVMPSTTTSTSRHITKAPPIAPTMNKQQEPKNTIPVHSNIKATKVHVPSKKQPPVEKQETVRSRSSVPNKDEDFSFQALKQRALKLEGKNPLAPTPKQAQGQRRTDNLEDYSFKKLKEKALNGPNTPLRNKSTSTMNTQAPKTPMRTPAKRSIPMTPQSIGSKTKSRCCTPLRPHIPMPMNSSSQCSRSSSTLQKTIHKGQEVSTPNRSGVTATVTNGTTFNPHRFKFGPKVKKEEVQATDDTNASVQKISQWLSDDPFGKKKQVVIRRGMQIVQKSRAFEQDQVLKQMVDGNRKESRVEREKEHFPQGKVSQGKNWLKSAFGEEEEVQEEVSGVLAKQKMISNAFKRSTSNGSHYSN